MPCILGTCSPGKFPRLRLSYGPPMIRCMNGISIYVNWEYFLGILGALIGLAYYANGRLTRLETSVDWLAETVRELAIRAENVSQKLFAAQSPVELTHAGRRILESSGLKSYIDGRKDELLRRCRVGRSRDDREIQAAAFRLFVELPFEGPFGRSLNQFAFANGMSMDLLRRAGAIYLRDLGTKG
jgi:hypothetical protein